RMVRPSWSKAQHARGAMAKETGARKRSSKRSKAATALAPKTAKRRTAQRATSKFPRADTSAASGAQAEQPPPQKVEMPRIEPPPRVELDMEGSAQWLKRMDRRKATFLCTFEWSLSYFSHRMESYYTQRARTHWVLWLKRYDDNR